MTEDVKIRRVELVEQKVEGKPLGRHVEHDPRSRSFAIVTAQPVPIVEVLHKRHGLPFNQGSLGSCTGNATAGAINTEPLFRAHRKTLLHESDAVAIYTLATALDGFDGTYPPDDTGSSGLAAAKAALQKKLIGSYRHAFSTDDALAALMSNPVITGVDWYEGFDHPDPDGVVRIAGQARGGHEFEVVGFHPAKQGDVKLDGLVECVNSWGTTWGKKGHFFFTARTWDQLLQNQGDVTVLMP